MRIKNWVPEAADPFVFVLCGILLYWQTLHYGFAAVDDYLLITGNPLVQGRDVQSLLAMFSQDLKLYIPVTYLFWRFLDIAGGGSPVAYHAASIVLHIANVCMAYGFCKTITKRRSIACICALLYLIHPIQVEVVAWPSAIRDALAAFFFWSSLTAYTRWIQCESRAYYFSSILLFGLGLGSKVSIVGLPLLLPFIHTLVKKEQLSLRQLSPYVVLAALFGGYALLLKERVVGFVGLSQHMLLGIHSFSFYISKILQPYDLVIANTASQLYLHTPMVLLGLALIISTVVGILVTYTSKPLFAFGVVFYCVLIAPSLANTVVGGEVVYGANRYVYVASFGLFLIMASAFDQLLAMSRRITVQRCIQCLFVAYICVLCSISVGEVQKWRNEHSLFRSAQHQEDSSYFMLIGLGNTLFLEGDYQAAIYEYKKALDINTHSVMAAGNMAIAQANLGQFDLAIQNIEHAQSIAPPNAELLFRKGQIYGMMGNEELAKQYIIESISLDPAFAEEQLYLFGNQNM